MRWISCDLGLQEAFEPCNVVAGVHGVNQNICRTCSGWWLVVGVANGNGCLYADHGGKRDITDQ